MKHFQLFIFALIFSYSSFAQSTITIHNHPTDITVGCLNNDTDIEAVDNWIDAYISNPSNASTDCNDPDIFWMADWVPSPTHCGTQVVYFNATDLCGGMESTTAIITFEDTSPPVLSGNFPQLTQAQCGSASADVSFWINQIENQAFEENCGPAHLLTITNDCNGCVVLCNSTTDVTFTVEDHCNNSAQFVFTLEVDDDPDGDGIDSPMDNCPMNYNPGQEDIDDDGIGNPCDNSNSPGQFAEVQDNLYLNKPYSGVIVKSQNDSCWIITVNNDGSLATISVNCP